MTLEIDEALQALEFGAEAIGFHYPDLEEALWVLIEDHKRLRSLETESASPGTEPRDTGALRRLPHLNPQPNPKSRENASQGP